MKSKDAWLVIGADGMIGSALADYLGGAGKRVIQTRRNGNFSLAESLIIDLAQDILNIELPVNVSVAYLCAAVTSMQECRENPEGSSLVNVNNTITLARKLVESGAFVVFLSSSMVFDGALPFRKAEDPVCPMTEYGRQKAKVEKELLSLEDRTAVVRLSKVLGPGNVLFRKWIMDLRNGITIHPFADLVFSPVSNAFAIQVLFEIGERNLSGIIQVSGESEITYEQAARYIANIIGANPNLIKPVLSRQSGLNLESVPRHSTLDISRLRNELGMVPDDTWRTIKEVVDLR